MLEYAVYGGHQNVISYLESRGAPKDTYVLSMRSLLYSEEGKDVIFSFSNSDDEGVELKDPRVLMAHVIVLYCRLPPLLFKELLPHVGGLQIAKGSVLEVQVRLKKTPNLLPF